MASSDGSVCGVFYRPSFQPKFLAGAGYVAAQTSASVEANFYHSVEYIKCARTYISTCICTYIYIYMYVCIHVSIQLI